ncbi:MAG: MATE family efflux transporter [Pseudomonadota bacterium]
MFARIFTIAYPVIGSRLLSVLLEIISVWFVAKLGIDFLAAYGIAAPIYLALYMIAVSYLLVFSVKATHLKNQPTAYMHFTQAGIIFAAALSVAVMLTLCILPSGLLLIGQSPAVIHRAASFFYIIALGTPALFIATILTQALIIQGRSLFLTLTSLLQLLLGILSIAYFTKTTTSGLAGVALGFDIAYWFRLISVVLYCIYTKKITFCFQIKNIKHLYDDIYFLLKLGWPISLQYGGELLAASIAVLLMGHLSTSALAVQQLTSQLQILLIMIPYGLSQAAAIIVAENNFEKNTSYQSSRKTILRALIITGLALVLPICFFINLYSVSLIKFFLHPESHYIVFLASVFIAISSLAVFLETIRYILIGMLRGIKNTKVSMLCSLGSYYLIGLPLAYVLGYVFNFHTIGIRIGMTLGLLCGVIFLLFYYNYYFSKYEISFKSNREVYI